MALPHRPCRCRKALVEISNRHCSFATWGAVQAANIKSALNGGQGFNPETTFLQGFVVI